MKKIVLSAVVLIIMASGKLYAQTQHQNSGWFMFLNNTKFNDKWGLQFDVQLRSADDWGYLRNTLVRPALQYFINNKHNVALGYLWQTTHTESAESPDLTLHEHRIFEQYIYSHKIKSVFASHRFRVEQRFIGRTGEDVFSQRFRYFFRLVQPLQKTQPTFTKGPFVALQNEVFLNLQNKDKINSSVFDQNRLYLAAGYRFSKQFDLEAGYMNQATHGVLNNTVNNIIQLAVYTRF
ncbi:DUF2490 domain-containing protein [Pedobacter sp. ISL-68]|uniref:DUF2490 domain-containing protein n=1 Tax=unclassified Pedobacter TaxID=2628915 RepID=UPI001BE5B38C|nr:MULTISPECIES: DUF2490 domain-containing protein [unclassified Pedobacter]MBT2560011.1 DUF2490 domain-containing protein [Pedobacter sp. ISL-64]MBT2592315.1 DUF2490 domain-containing protein [Pedobacter sp. ISL-68]